MEKKKIIKKPVGKGKKSVGFPKIIKTRRKADHCLNCGTRFDPTFNYCPECGQENNHNQVSFATLVIDFFNNYFSFDSKFSLSLLPFFLEPGYLTLQFIEGKRASFVNPIRLYLIVSLLFFFVFSMVSTDLIQKNVEDMKATTENLPDSSKAVLDKVLTGDLSDIKSDSLYRFVPESKDSGGRNISYSVQKPDSTNDFLTDENIKLYMSLRKDYNLSAQQVLDSLNTGSLTPFQYKLTRQFIRLDRAEAQIVISQLLKNLPLMMLFTLPFFALLLKLFYIRRNEYYITHLVHALHLHSFAYLLYGLTFVAAMYWIPTASLATWTIIIGVVLVSTHSYISFLRVYGQGWFKTLIKFNFIGFLYLWILLFAVLIEIFLSVATY